jgi:glycosyltransferase involved in cell wall biosynthesis
MRTGTVIETSSSSSWDAASADVSVVVATHARADLLTGLFDALAAQTASVEVVIADDGSPDDTWQRLLAITATTALPVLALRLEHTGGPSIPRNTAAAHARKDVLAVTDDDCLPQPEWAATIAAAVRDGVAVAQGRTVPVGPRPGPWDRTVAVEQPSWLFETCNLGFDREQFMELGGFPVVSILEHLPRGFGEDVLFGALAARVGGFSWEPEAVVRHRWIPTSYRGHLDGVRRLSGFPWLAREVPEVAQLLTARVFLSRRTVEFDAALASVLAAAVSRQPLVLVAVLPWLRRVVTAAARRPGPLSARLAQEAAADAVGFASLVRGSVRHRRVVL